MHLHRRLILVLEDLGYTIRSGLDENFRLDKETLGESTGIVSSKIRGIKQVYGSGSITYKHTSSLAIIVLVLLMVTGLAIAAASGGNPGAAAAGILLFLFTTFGLYQISKRSLRSDQFNVLRNTEVRVLTSGEVTEKKIQRESDQITELAAQLIVSTAGVVSINVVGNVDLGTKDALLQKAPVAFQPHPYTSSGLRQLLSKETNDRAMAELQIVQNDINALINRLSESWAERPTSPTVSAQHISPRPASESPRLSSEIVAAARREFENIDPKEFQSIMAKVFRGLGYQVEEQPYVGDFGADLILRTGTHVFLVQLKKYASHNKVGAPEVQRTIGAMAKFEAEKAILVTTSTFTLQAVEQASIDVYVI